MICVTPPPPIYIVKAEINPLNAGIYTLSTYHVPYEDTFPPAIADYPAYFAESFELQVFGQPAAVSVNTTTNLGLVLLALLMLLAGTLFHKRRIF